VTHSNRSLWLSLLGVAAAQILFLSWMVWDRVSMLQSAREITLKVVPVDPRDIFRGDYVVLGYDVSRIAYVAEKNGPFPGDLWNGRSVYVRLTPDAEAGWKAVKLTPTYPDGVPSGDVVLRGRIDNLWEEAETKTTHVNVTYGIESYFVPENTGRELEQQVRDKKIEAVVAVGNDGETALKALVVEGKRIHEQPLL
jgi:uncharacterized membrane-anchored protein